MKTQTIRADQVKPGDRIFNSQATHPAFQWVGVIRVEPTQVPVVLEGGRTVHIPGVRLVTGAWETYEPADVGIAVQRF